MSKPETGTRRLYSGPPYLFVCEGFAPSLVLHFFTMFIFTLYLYLQKCFLHISKEYVWLYSCFYQYVPRICGCIAKPLCIQSFMLLDEKSGLTLAWKTILTFVVVALSLTKAYEASNKFCFQLFFSGTFSMISSFNWSSTIFVYSCFKLSLLSNFFSRFYSLFLH